MIRPTFAQSILLLPLILGLAGLWGVIDDLKHPNSQTDECRVVAVGSEVRQALRSPQQLYLHSDNVKHDVGFSCKQQGDVMVNHYEPYSEVTGSDFLSKGRLASITRKSYRWLPDRWQVDVMAAKN